jgi:hypothetical protein
MRHIVESPWQGIEFLQCLIVGQNGYAKILKFIHSSSTVLHSSSTVHPSFPIHSSTILHHSTIALHSQLYHRFTARAKSSEILREPFLLPLARLRRQGHLAALDSPKSSSLYIRAAGPVRVCYIYTVYTVQDLYSGACA